MFEIYDVGNQKNYLAYLNGKGYDPNWDYIGSFKHFYEAENFKKTLGEGYYVIVGGMC